MNRTMSSFLICAMLAMVALGALAEDKPDYGDSTLKYYASQSDRIVVAEVLTEKVSGAATASGQVRYDFKAVVKEVVKGEDKKADELSVKAIRWDLHQSQQALPVLKKGTLLILFLSKDDRTVDQWFGIQPFNSWMAAFLKTIISAASVKMSNDVALPNDAEIRSLIERLGSKEPKDAGVEANLRLAGSRAVPGLIDALSSKDYLTRDRAAQALGLIGDGSAVPALVRMAKQKEDRYKSALDALGAIGGPDAAEYLLAALSKEAPGNPPDMIRDLGQIGDNRAVPSLCGILKDSANVKLRRPAAEALGRFRDPRSRAALEHAVAHDSDWDVYRTAKMSLLRLISGKEPAEQYKECRKLVEIIVRKSPEPPEGEMEWLRRYREAHPPSPKAPKYDSPTVHLFVLPAVYEAARKELLAYAQHPSNADTLVEFLLEHMRHRQLREDDPGGKAMRLIVEIGKPAVPALENAVKRGDETLKAHAARCLKDIDSARAPSTGGADKIEPATGKDTAIAYFEALTMGDAEGINALVAAPFSFDRKQVLQTKEDVEKQHREVVAKKGKRKVPEYTVSISPKAPELDRKLFPEYEVFRITLAGDDEHVDIYVSKGASPKVIGFSD